MSRLPSPLAARRGAVALLVAPALAVLTGSSAGAPAAGGAADTPTHSPAVEACAEDAPGWSARVRAGAKQPEPPMYAKKDARKYGVVKDAPYLGDASVEIDTVFHVITETEPAPGEKAALEQQVADQMAVLNASFSGATAQDRAAATGGTDTPFRFDLVETTWTADEQWAVLAPGKEERAMKSALHQGDSETLNVYVTQLEGGLLGFAYFPKAYNKGRAYLDGVVMLDGALPGGYAGPYNQGDTLVHEVGHWLMLEHTFHGGCSASNDGVADTPREAHPQFGCPVGADTCETPGLDPVHNFMDYVDDECMDEFTPGQAERMSDAWVAFRAGGDG